MLAHALSWLALPDTLAHGAGMRPQVRRRKGQNPRLAEVAIPRLYSGMKTAISLPDDLFADADRFAEQVGMSRSQLYATALAEFLARHRDADVTAALDRVYAEPLTVDPSEQNAAREALRRSEWK